MGAGDFAGAKSTAFHTFPQAISQGSPSVLLTQCQARQKLRNGMARYSAFLGRRVEVQYRAADIVLPASGIFVADSGRSIFLEQRLEQRGQARHFRWEIPYQYLVRIEEIAEPPETPPAPKPQAKSVTSAVANDSPRTAPASPSLFSLPDRAKTA